MTNHKSFRKSIQALTIMKDLIYPVNIPHTILVINKRFKRKKTVYCHSTKNTNVLCLWCESFLITSVLLFFPLPEADFICTSKHLLPLKKMANNLFRKGLEKLFLKVFKGHGIFKGFWNFHFFIAYDYCCKFPLSIVRAHHFFNLLNHSFFLFKQFCLKTYEFKKKLTNQSFGI